MQPSAEEEEQLSCLRSWIASVIGDGCPPDLRDAFHDSQCLVAMVEALDASKMLAPELSPRSEEDTLLNFATIIDFLNRRGFRLATNAQGLMMSRDVKGLLQVLWAMAEFFVCIPQFSRYSQGGWREGAKRWVDTIVKKGAVSAVEVGDFTSSFKDGVILLVIIAQGASPPSFILLPPSPLPFLTLLPPISLPLPSLSRSPAMTSVAQHGRRRMSMWK